MALKCYHTDWEENKSAWKRKTQQKDADKIVKKLRRHFNVRWDDGKVSALYIERRKGTASKTNNRITLPKKDISLGIINHEIAHLVARKRYASKGHDKKFMRALKLVNRYAQKKKFFDAEVQWSCKSKPMQTTFRLPYGLNFKWED